jgi:hypothetical protein
MPGAFTILRRLASGPSGPALKLLYGRLTWFFYAGRRFCCPCCGGHFRALRDFRPRGGKTFVGVRANAHCPRCGSLERHRLLWLFFQRETDLFRSSLRVLCVAPEYLFQKRLRALPRLDYLSIDLDSPLAMEKADITALPYADGSFDVILCNHVLEHIPDDHRAMSELCRVLRPGGWAVLQTPVDKERAATFEDPGVESPEERARLFGQTDHVRIYGRDYPDRLRQAGFAVEEIDYAARLGPEAVEFYSLHYIDDIYYCTRPAQAP